MAGHPTELLVLYPCALGSLVLSKAYAVLRAAAAPRLVPPGMTLVQANARLSIFGLASTLVLGTSIGIVIKATGSYTFGLLVTAIAFGVCAYFAVKLPRQIDSPQSITSGGQVRNTRPKAEAKMRPMRRFLGWATQNFDADLIIALQAEAVLRFMAGALTIFLAFWVEAGAHGMIAALQLGAVIGAAGFGNFTGTAIGTRIKLARPNRLILASLAVAAVVSIVVALLFTVGLAIIGMFICSVANAQSKIALDSLIQRDVPEAQRSSAFGRSETFLQLAWVFGAAVGVVLPTGVGGAVVFWVIGGVAAAVAVIALLRTRAIARAGAAHEAREPRTRPGTVAGDPNAR
jgi:predicted MFS family arabinose efflux permease